MNPHVTLKRFEIVEFVVAPKHTVGLGKALTGSRPARPKA
jgi:hypothetical protein